MTDNHIVVVPSIVQAVNLHKQVRTGETELVILQDINLEIGRSETVAITGTSGSGKSTLLGLLAGLDTPSGGRVYLDGQDIFLLDEDQRAALRGRMLGFMFQSFQLLPALTAIENTMLPLELAGKQHARQAAAELLGQVGLATRLNHYPNQLSGGEQQRVAIARAFVTRPQLLLADEPTGNLDSATGAQIIELMFALNREHGTTLILVTHDDIISARCNRKIRLSGGRMLN